MMENRRVPNYGNYHEPRNGKSGTIVVLTVIIAILLAIIVAGVVLYMKSKNDEVDKLKQEQIELKDKNEQLSEQNQQLNEQNSRRQERVATGQRTQQQHSESYNGSGRKVVIDGTGVRLRFKPSLNAGYLTWANGQTRSVKKGTRLQYIGETDGWYEVSYLGNTFFVSKDFSYLEY